MSGASAWQLEQAVSVLMALRHDEAMASDETDLMNAIENGEEDVTTLLRKVILAIGENEAFADAVKERVEALTIRRKRFEARRDALRRTAFSVMDILGKTVLTEPEFTATIRKGSPTPVITDEAALPEEYVKISRSPDKTKISADLKQGVVIPGVELSNALPSLTIRRA